MNIIEAWKKAKVGQKIHSGSMEIEKMSDSLAKKDLLRAVINRFDDDSYLLADNWEIKKGESKIQVPMREIKMMIRGINEYDGSLVSRSQFMEIPNNAKVTIEWEE